MAVTVSENFPVMIFLGLDCGTQSTRALALDADSGVVLAAANKGYDILPGLPGHMEQNPVTWLEAMDEVLQQVTAALRDRRGEVRGIGVSGQQHGFVPMDGDGNVIRPAKLWNDTSSAEECDLFRRHFGSAAVLIEEIGLDMLPGYTAPKILWLKRHEPENFARLALVLLPHDFLNFYLTGQLRAEYGDGSGTALMDIRRRTWHPALLKFIDPALEGKMPPLRSSLQATGTLRPDLAQRWGLPDDVIVSAGGGDNMMGAIGTGNVSAGRVTASLGTSGTIYAYSNKPVVDPQGEVAAFCDSTDAWLPLVCTMNVTSVMDLVRRLFGYSLARMEDTIRTVPAGSDGLLFLPYLQGERTPNLARGTASYHGLNPRNLSMPHLIRATMEGITFGLGYGLQRMEMLGIKPTEIRLTGGGSKSAVWRQICADIFGCPVTTLAETEGAALGAAIQALAAVKTEKSVNAWADLLVKTNSGETAEPNPTFFDYAAAQQKHTALMRALVSGGCL
jgi:xylulokinase